MVQTKYNHPPIEEAICQFTLAQRLPWDAETPRRLFEKLRNRYPAMPTQEQILQANLTTGSGAETPGLAIAPTERVVFTDTQNRSRLSVGPQTIGIHRTRPYIGFTDDMLPRINADIPTVTGLFGADPLFSGVSVRYINRIDIQATEFDLRDYFNYGVTAEMLPPGFDGTITGFFSRTAAKEKDQPLVLTLNFGSVVAPKDAAAFVLDIDLGYNFEEPVRTQQATAKAVEIKAIENSVFESLITDATRGLFT